MLWKNLTDPILTEREELGFSKIYCDIPQMRVYQGTTHCTVSWMGFRFLDLSVSNLQEFSESEMSELNQPANDGTLHYKYMPRTEEWGVADSCHAVLTPSHNPNRRIVRAFRGEGDVAFQEGVIPLLRRFPGFFE